MEAVLAEHFPQAGALPLTAEVSPRRYFRLEGVTPEADGRSCLLVYSPDPAPQATTAFLQQLGLRVPELREVEKGYYLCEDLGDLHLAQEPDLESYRLLLRDWRKLSQHAIDAERPNPDLALDRALFERELTMFRECYLKELRGVDASLLAQLEPTCGMLADEAARGPQCLQHRDFHSRNLLLCGGGEIAWIDHQDLRLGPLFYDLASLYTDAYVDLEDAHFDLLREEVVQLGESFGLAAEDAMTQFLWTATQRVLKALGTFGKVIGEGREDFLAAEARARPMALALCDQLPGLEGIRRLLA